MQIRKLKLNLQYFNNGGAGTPAGNAVGTTSSQGNGKVAEKVVYGKQSDQVADGQSADAGTIDDNGNTDNQQQIIDKATQFEEMIKGDYKTEFDLRVKSILDNRFKNHSKELQGLKDYQQQANEVLSVLAEKYGTKDIDKLGQAIMNDDNLLEELASEKGMTVEQFKYTRQLEKENAVFKEIREREELEQKKTETINRWMSEEKDLKNIYPNFSLDEEIKNPNFARLLQNGIPMHDAYNTVHINEILPTAMQQTATAVKKQVTNNIQARGLRPSENGLNQQAGVIVKNDVSKLTAKDRQEIARRVARGEKIAF